MSVVLVLSPVPLSKSAAMDSPYTHLSIACSNSDTFESVGKKSIILEDVAETPLAAPSTAAGAANRDRTAQRHKRQLQATGLLLHKRRRSSKLTAARAGFCARCCRQATMLTCSSVPWLRNVFRAFSLAASGRGSHFVYVSHDDCIASSFSALRSLSFVSAICHVSCREQDKYSCFSAVGCGSKQEPTSRSS